MPRKNCVICSAEFETRTRAEVCSVKCHEERARRYLRRYRSENYRSQCRVESISCEICGKSVKPFSRIQKLCKSEECAKEKRRRYMQDPERKKRVRAYMAAYYRRPERKEKAIEYNRTSPKAKALREKYRQNGKTTEYQKSSQRRRKQAELSLQLLMIGSTLEEANVRTGDTDVR